ncbi:MAG: cytochrome c biogenesis protein [Coriobacteriia bacterium]|nr:cytochrome c biogenesis protein [Coriobacteriia bacterium]
MLETASVHSFWLSFVFLLAASVLFARQMLVRERAAGSVASVAAQIITGLAWISLSLSIGFNSMVHHRTPLTGANTLVLIAWVLVLVYFAIEYLFRFKLYGSVLIPISAVLLFIAEVSAAVGGSVGAVAPAHVSAQVNNTVITFHVLLIIIASVLLLIGAVASVLYLYRDHQLRTHKVSVLSRRLPALGNLERLASRLITIALPIYFAAQILGITRAIADRVNGWFFDPRIMFSGVVLVVFIVYGVLYHRQKTSGVVTAWIAVGGGLCVVVLMILARALPVGFHTFGLIR